MLIIVESPAKAKTISKIVGKDFTVIASVGHVRKISNESRTKDDRKLEINGIDIEKNFTPIFIVDPAKKKVVSELKKLAKINTDGILFATDSDREGEAISWHLAEIIGVKDKSKVKRLEFHEITKSAIHHALENPRPLNMELVHAQQARQVLDKLVGYKLSPVLWKVLNNYKLSAGRVQTPALVLISIRENEILSFVPQEFWEINGNFTESNTKPPVPIDYLDDTNKIDIENQDWFFKLTKTTGNKVPKIIDSRLALDNLVKDLHTESEFKVSSVTEKQETTQTRPPFTTSTLQQAASSKLGYSPKMTMQLAQKLYEGIIIDGSPTGLITYMRTDSVNLSVESITSARGFISKNYSEFLPEKPKYYKGKSRNAQEAHEAIRPTDPNRTPAQLSTKVEPKLLKLYELIWKQTIASQMTNELRNRVTITVENKNKDEFSGSVAWTIHKGFKVLTGEEIKQKPNVILENGASIYLEKLFYHQKFTKPPTRYSAASLIKKLEELGIGRPSTYASIISTLQDRGYVDSSSKSMIPSSLGLTIAKILTENFENITDQRLTATMENELDEISRGEKTYEGVLDKFWSGFASEVDTKLLGLKDKREEYTSTSSEEKCPTCHGEMKQRIGRFGQYLQCQEDKAHMFALNYKEYEATLKESLELFGSQTSGQNCEECKKEMIVRVSKNTLNPYIACAEYKVGNKHTVTNVHYGPCPQCAEEGRGGKKQGHLIVKRSRGKNQANYWTCDLGKKICDYTAKTNPLKST
jgi:DNA topoisomerase I